MSQVASIEDSVTVSSTVAGGNTVPWHTVQNHSECPGGKPWAVVKNQTDEVEGCHANEDDANAQVAALYAAEADAGNETAVTDTLARHEDCPPGQHRMPDGECMPDSEMTDEHEYVDTSFVVDKPWDGAASRFTDEQYQRSTAACDPGDGTPKQRCFLPHHEPGGALNRSGVHAAAQRAGQLKGRDPAAVARAKSHLRGHYRQLGEEAPGSISSGESEAFVTESLDLSGEGAGWEGVLVVEGESTGDGREFAAESITWAELPIPLRWNTEDSHGGEPRTTAVLVGRIDEVERDGSRIIGRGVFDLGGEHGREAHRLVKEGFLKGVSIDSDDITNADIEYVWPDDHDDDEISVLETLLGPEKMVFHAGRIRAATLVDIPAFVEAYIKLTSDDAEPVLMASSDSTRIINEPADPTSGRLSTWITNEVLVAHAVSAEWRPSADWFVNPDLNVPIGITVTDEGRVYGHAAQWGECHIGHPDLCVTPPREDDHPYFMTGEMVCADGSRVSVGQVTVGTGHASLAYGATRATEHYDHTGAAVADVVVGNDVHGIWVAGVVRPNVEASYVHDLRASGQLSGDWRRIGGKLRLVALLAVNVPGFPVPRLRARVASGDALALVAAGRPTISRPMLTEKELSRRAMRALADNVARRVHAVRGE